MHRVIDTIDSLLKSQSVTIKIDELSELRILQLSDSEDLFTAVENNRTHLREWLPWVESNQTIQDTKRFIQTVIEQYKANEGFQCGIWFKGVLVGVVGFHRIDWMNKNVEIGYWIDKEHEGKGLMTKSCKALVDYAFNELQLKRVQIRCATGNMKSCRIPERLGFRKEGLTLQAEYLYGRFVDLVVYGMTGTEWAKISGQDVARKEIILSAADPRDVESIDAIVKTLYECVTFAPGIRPDYARLRSLCHFGARFIPSKTTRDETVSVLHTEEFIARSDKYVGETEFGKKGFHEHEVARRTELFGNIAHVFSTYESRFSKNDAHPIARGINSIQLVRDHGRWWIVSVIWDSEKPESPIPPEFLRNQG